MFHEHLAEAFHVLARTGIKVAWQVLVLYLMAVYPPGTPLGDNTICHTLRILARNEPALLNR